jgi:hypothetical protein
MHLVRTKGGFVCIFNRSPSQVKPGFGPVLLPCYDPRMKRSKLSLAPLKFEEAVSDLLHIKPESKEKSQPKTKAKRKRKAKK